MARRRSRRRKRSYRNEGESSGYPPHLVLEDLSPRARRLVEGRLIDVSIIEGSGEDGRITSGDILHAARVMEVQQSVARIEATGNVAGVGDATAEDRTAPAEESQLEPSDPIPGPPSDSSPDLTADGGEEVPEITDAATTSGSKAGGDPVSVPPSPWEAYNGVSEGLAESALPGAEQSWGEAEANIEAIAQEAAARIGVEPDDIPPPTEEASAPIVDSVPPAGVVEEYGAMVGSAAMGSEPFAPQDSEPELIEPEPAEPGPITPESVPVDESLVAAPATPEPVIQPPVAADEPLPVAAQAASSSPDAEAEQNVERVPVAAAGQPQPLSQQGRVMMDFGTLELVDPESVWAEGAEDFAPWFLAHSRQLGDVLGLEAGLSEARQFTTRSATGVIGRDDGGEDVVVVSSQKAVAEDADLGHALGMAASSGAATVALVSAKFEEEQLQALAWLNNQTKSGVQWYGIEMKVVRIADSPAAMLFELVASPPPT